MSSDPCFSMADMYGSALIGESKGKEEKKSGSVAEDGEDEDAKMPLRTESIYNLAFIQRPTTAIITHGGAGDDADVADSTTILEEDEDERKDLKSGFLACNSSRASSNSLFMVLVMFSGTLPCLALPRTSSKSDSATMPHS